MPKDPVHQQLHDPSELTYEELVSIVQKVQSALWPDNEIHPDVEPEVQIEQISDVLIEAGIGPDYG